jgi:glycosidase
VLPPLEFHISRRGRDDYRFDRDLALHGRPDISVVHDLALRMNQKDRNVKPGELFSLVLLHQVFHRAVDFYCTHHQPRLFELAVGKLAESLGSASQDMLVDFATAFPPLPVYRNETDARQFLQTSDEGQSPQGRLIEQMLFVYLNNRNPACGNLRELFDEQTLSKRDLYYRTVDTLKEFLKQQPATGKLGLTLFDLLESPLKASPHSLAGQLRFIVTNWGLPLDPELERLLLLAQDLMREDETRRAPGPGPAMVPEFVDWASETLPERYSADTEWMPRAVLMAKSVHVWLDQLSKIHRREIKRLDQIPDEELAKLARWGFTALWLIGLWERSRASQKIKHVRGNIDAVASAYSLYEYRIANDLGGDEALDNLRERAWRHGIRLACDVVPNHMGIDSRWVIEHPEWFIQTEHPPYPDYHFTGPDLSGDPRISLRIEDGYWNQTNAAVVFEWRDHWTGQVRYIYHGNDGTSTPWNDTAQLNFLLPEVRAAVVQLILNVARRFSLIRFDAAMTLTRMHYQRLWFPPPGEGGAIPSRAWFGMSKADFDRHMPNEFWREVVDRVNAEAPDTLLLAEAFWLTEGLFVRTLGMHRVYNSAFMNMLKAEDNANYQRLIRNVLGYDPRILERYVNFMSNPDEATAIEQFGKDDKYFGVAMMLATLPGLPMFGHGQIEGYTEKYGHEYRRAYYEESPESALMERHEREIFPILNRRHLFARAERFALHDFVTPEGHGNDDVFAYSNRTGDTHTLVVYHNRYAETRGWIRDTHDRRTLVSQLHLHPRPNLFVIFRDLVSGLEYLRDCGTLHHDGFYVELRAFQYHVFTDFREVEDRGGRYRQVAERLQGKGTLSIHREVQRIIYAPLIAAFADFASPRNFRDLFLNDQPVSERAHEFAERALPFLQQAQIFANAEHSPDDVAGATERMATGVLDHLGARTETADEPQALETNPELRVLGGWLAVSQIGQPSTSADAGNRGAQWIDEWFLSETLADTFVLLGADRARAEREAVLVRVLTAHQDIADTFDGVRQFEGVVEMLDDPAVRRFLHTHTSQSTEWYRAEALQELLEWLALIERVHALADPQRARHREITRKSFALIGELAAVSEYEVGRFRELLGYAAKPVRTKTEG